MAPKPPTKQATLGYVKSGQMTLGCVRALQHLASLSHTFSRCFLPLLDFVSEECMHG